MPIFRALVSYGTLSPLRICPQVVDIKTPLWLVSQRKHKLIICVKGLYTDNFYFSFFSVDQSRSRVKSCHPSGDSVISQPKKKTQANACQYTAGAGLYNNGIRMSMKWQNLLLCVSVCALLWNSYSFVIDNRIIMGVSGVSI